MSNREFQEDRARIAPLMRQDSDPSRQYRQYTECLLTPLKVVVPEVCGEVSGCVRADLLRGIEQT